MREKNIFDAPPADPLAIFGDWLAAAEASEPNDPSAMALATADADGLPNVRMVLLKGFGAGGFTFYTNQTSAKGDELATNGQAALCFHWKSLRRQVRVRGQVATASADEADAYFATRSRESRLGAWASQQSQTLASRAALEAAYAEYDTKYPSDDVPRPPHWAGYRVAPLAIEFWQDGAHRLHDRLLYHRATLADDWQTTRLYP